MTTARISAALALVATLAACGGGDDDNGVGPTLGANCVVGSMNVGDTRTVTLGQGAGCRLPLYYERNSPGATVDSSFAAAYNVDLVAGQAYQFTVDNDDGAPRGSLDLVLTVFGPSRVTSGTSYLAASDDEGVGASASLIFVAPTTGRYAVAVGSFDDVETGRVKLASRACGTIGTITTSGELPNRQLTPASCVDYDLVSESDSTRATALRVQFAAGETKTITVASNTPGFFPRAFIGGVGADTYDYTTAGYDELYFGGDSDVAVATFTAPAAGMYTILIGNGAMSATTSFDVFVDEGAPLGMSATVRALAIGTRALKTER